MITALYKNSAGGTAVTGTGTFTVAAGTQEQFTAVAVTPNFSVSVSVRSNQPAYCAWHLREQRPSTGCHSLEEDRVDFQYSIYRFGDSSGLVSGLSSGSSIITAKLTNLDGTVVTDTATVAVSNTNAPGSLLSLQVIPGSIAVDHFRIRGISWQSERSRRLHSLET